MKKLFSWTLAILSLCAFDVSGNEQPQDPHEIYFGADFLNLDLDLDIKDVHVKGQRDLLGVELGYEYLSPWAFYAGLDILSSGDSQSVRASQDGKQIHASNQGIVFSKIDLRFGYTTVVKQFYFTPFLGTGIFSIGSFAKNRGLHEGCLYLSGGLRSKFPLNTAFSIGVNLQAYKAASFQQFKNHDVSVKVYSYPWGGEVGIPLIWNFNPQGSWTFQLEPWFSRLPFSGRQSIVGSKFLIGSHF